MGGGGGICRVKHEIGYFFDICYVSSNPYLKKFSWFQNYKMYRKIGRKGTENYLFIPKEPVKKTFSYRKYNFYTHI